MGVATWGKTLRGKEQAKGQPAAQTAGAILMHEHGRLRPAQARNAFFHGACATKKLIIVQQ